MNRALSHSNQLKPRDFLLATIQNNREEDAYKTTEEMVREIAKVKSRMRWYEECMISLVKEREASACVAAEVEELPPMPNKTEIQVALNKIQEDMEKDLASLTYLFDIWYRFLVASI